ncbi:FAD-dependent monooxygenase [Consotaella aegiceratis]|uniref:FAD-dependent monooxygenase n=1 Tax=Consotaella aegiceratis TaxID=3097961 RepID=UPI002F41AAD1
MTDSETQSLDCEVLVVGAGPTGLMAANLLRRSGVDVRIVDQRRQPSQESRAFAVSARSLELFASLGLADRLFEHGVVNSQIQFFISGDHVGGLDFDRASSDDTPFQFILMIPQSRTEAVLLDALREDGIEVERGVDVTGFEQDEAGVRVTAKRGDDASFEIAAGYVIGADGAHSIVRNGLNLRFEGAKYPQSFLLGDVAVDWELDHARFRVFMHGERIGLFFPLHGSNLSRVMTTDMSGQTSSDADEQAELALEDLEASFQKAAGLPVRLRDPTWLTHFRTHHRVVDRYRVGRVFVAGDAAHIHSPAGGQGMNTGLQDAANLAWKLAALLRGGADDALLDTYESERLPVAREVLRFTDRLFEAAAGQTGWRARMRDLLAPVIVGPGSNLDFIQDKAFRKFAQIDILYAPGRFVGGGAVEDRTGPSPRPGERAPNARLSRHRDVFDLTVGYRFHALALSHKPLVEDEAAALSSQLAALSQAGAESHLIARLAHGQRAGVEHVENASVFDRYGLKGDDAQALVLVRPDGYIAWRAESLDIEGCRRFLARLGGGAPPV